LGDCVVVVVVVDVFTATPDFLIFLCFNNILFIFMLDFLRFPLFLPATPAMTSGASATDDDNDCASCVCFLDACETRPPRRPLVVIAVVAGGGGDGGEYCDETIIRLESALVLLLVLALALALVARTASNTIRALIPGGCSPIPSASSCVSRDDDDASSVEFWTS
jgi:hypothetical protein